MKSIALPALLILAATALHASASDTEVSYHRDIAPVIYENCTGCHREGENAPFPLSTYEEVSRKARTIARVVEDRYMPPWHANPETTDFLGVRRLEDGEIERIARWVAAGKPEGVPADAPPEPSFPHGWQLEEPDLVLTMDEAFPVPAEGPDIYRNFALPIDRDTDEWVKAIELRPSARNVVHHSLFFLDDTGTARKLDGQDGKPGFSGMGFERSGSLGVYVPGTTPRELPDDLARPLPAGSDLVLSTHFHPTGKPEREKTRVGIHFADEPPSQKLREVQVPPDFGRHADIDIPAGESNYVVEATYRLPAAARAICVSGHAHYICETMKMTAELPGGSEKVLLDIPDWDLDWQDTYYFAEPISLPADTILKSVITYDNSAANPDNPFHPPRRIEWGRESTDEMGSITLTGVLLEDGAEKANRGASHAVQASQTAQASKTEKTKRADQTEEADGEAPVARVDLFVSVDCPVANSYAPEIDRLHETYAPEGVRFRLVYPDTTVDEKAVEEHVAEYDLEPETTIDREHRLVERAGATITPEAAVYDRTGELVYRGRIDNLYADFGDRRRVVTEHDVREVLDALLAGHPVEFRETDAIGCTIERPVASDESTQ